MTDSIVARRGDTVLIGFNRLLSDDEFRSLSEHLKPLTEKTGVRIAILDGVAQVVVVKGPEFDTNGSPARQETLEGYEVQGER